MIDPKAVIASWRLEIEAEFAEAQRALPPLQTAYDVATAAADEAASAHRAIQELLGKAQGTTDFLGVTKFQYLEGALGLRVNEYAKEVDRAKSLRARALADLEAARSNVTTLRRAIAQIDLINPPADESQEAA
jgi:hypothetical protein